MTKNKKTPIFIGITGTHCVGKTTLAKQLKTLCNRRGIKSEILEEVVRQVAELKDPNFKIHGEQTVYTTNLIIKNQIEHEEALKKQDLDVVFCDRTFIDPLYYLFSNDRYEYRLSRWLHIDKIEDLVFPNVYDVVREKSRYSTIIYVKLGTFYALQNGIESDGFRDTDKSLQFRVQENAEKILDSLYLDNLVRHFALTIPLDNDIYYNNLLDEVLH